MLPFTYNVIILDAHRFVTISQSPFEPITLKNILCLFLHDFVNLEVTVTQLLIG